MEERALKRLKKGNRRGGMDAQFFRDFASLYNSLRGSGMDTKDIKAEIKKTIDCQETRYYDFLREARKLGYITDQELTKAEKSKRSREIMNGINEKRREETPTFKEIPIEKQVAPLTVTSTTKVSNLSYVDIGPMNVEDVKQNLNCDLRDGYHEEDVIQTSRRKGLVATFRDFFRKKK